MPHIRRRVTQQVIVMNDRALKNTSFFTTCNKGGRTILGLLPTSDIHGPQVSFCTLKENEFNAEFLQRFGDGWYHKVRSGLNLQ